MALPFPPSADSWPDEIAEEARTEFGCTIDVLDPSNLITIPFDPVTDTGGAPTPATVVSGRAARAQHIRLPLENSGSGDWTTRRRYRFQIDLLEDDPAFTKGMIVKVTATDRNQALLTSVNIVQSAANSDHAPLRTIECISEGA